MEERREEREERREKRGGGEATWRAITAKAYLALHHGERGPPTRLLRRAKPVPQRRQQLRQFRPVGPNG
jgi:hypothetical protein